MHKIKFLLLLFSVFYIPFSAYAQLDSSSHKKQKGNLYFNIGAGPVFYSYKDLIVSPNTYTTQGFHPLLELGYEKNFPKYHGQTTLFFGPQNLNDAPGRSYGIIASQLLTGQFNTSRCWQLEKIIRDKIDWQFGYNVNIEYVHELNPKFQNAQYVFGLWANAGIANRFAFLFDLKGEKKLWFIHFNKPDYPFEVSWQLNVPLLGAITRTNYAGIFHFANGEFTNDFIRMMEDNITFTSLHNFQLVHSQIALNAPLGNHNQLKIAYVWEGFRYTNSLARLQGSYGGVMLSLMFKMDSRPVMGSRK